MSTAKPLLVVDLDETLILAVEEEMDQAFPVRCGLYYVYQRPFLREFCEVCERHYNVAVWTSSTADYARCVVDNALFFGQLQFVWSRDRCTKRFDPEAQDYYWVKDLKKVRRAGYDLSRVLVVDDTPKKLERNFGNLVQVRAFTGSQEDIELRLLAEYLSSIAGEPDFRSLEKRAWRRTV